MPVKKTVGSLILFLAGALSGHAYYNDFQSYAENQALTSGNDWTGNSNWRVVTLDGNKVLQLAPGSGEQEVAYTGESFTGVGAGYTIQMRMRFDIGSGELSQYSGFRMDAASSQPGAYNSRRFYFETTGYLGTGWNSVTGAGISFRSGCWYFLRVRRFGADSVTNNGGTLQIWASEFQITDKNAGTLIMNVTPPPDTDPQSAALGTFWLHGVAYGSDTVYVDELALSHGDTIMGGLLSYTEAPYDVCKANYLAANYMQALWDPVKKWLPYNEETYGDAVTRRGGFYYLEGQGRAINAFCHEADKGPVARLDLIADMAQGIINAAIPGSPGRHFYMVEGREALAYAANSDHFSLKWLQDASLGQYDVYVETRPDSSSAWTLVNPTNLTHTTTALDGGTRHTYTGSGVTVTLDSWCGVEDYAPVLTVATDSPCEVRLRLKNSASWANVADWTHFPVQSVITPSRTINSGSANAITGQLSVSLTTEEKRLLLRNDYKTYAARCPRSGWEAQANWQILDSYWLAAWDAAKAPDMVGTTSDERRIFTELALTWTDVTSVALRGAAYREIDPNDNYFVTASADTVATGIAHNFGIKPYSPVRTSLLYAQTLGLCAAATTLVNYQHTAAATVRAAAITAFGAAIASEDKGYYGEYLHNLIEAAWWLKQIEPTRYDYTTYVTRWANRLAARCPSPSAVPPWSDTAGRNVRGQYFANLVTGSSANLTAANNGLAAFSLPAGIDFEKYLLDTSGTGAITARPFNGGDCQGAASLLGLSGWQRKQEAGGQYIANRLVAESARFYHCDTGFVPVSSYNCHDLLPYYVGISLSTPFPTKPPTTVVGMSQYVRYDPSGAVSPTSRPIGYYIPPPAPVSLGVQTLSATSISLNWPALALGETGYVVERSLVGGSNYTQVATLDANTLGYNDTGLAPGTTYYYQVRACNNAGNGAASPEASALTRTLREDWRMIYFGTLVNSGSASDLADPDNDGGVNLMEYALNTNPNSATSSPSIIPAVDNNRLTVSFNRISDPTIVYSVQVSGDLSPGGSWQTIWSSTGVQNTSGPVTVTDPVDVTSNSRRFMRLKITATE